MIDEKVSGGLTVKEAAERLGVTPEFMRAALEQGRFPFGCGLYMNGQRRAFYISERLFEKYVAGEIQHINANVAR